MKSAIHEFLEKFVLFFISVSLIVGIGEIFFRYIDGFKQFTIQLTPITTVYTPNSSIQKVIGTSNQKALEAAVEELTTPIVKKDWFWLSPPKSDKGNPSEDTMRRLSEYPEDPYGAFFVWNKNYLKKALCEGSTLGSLGILKTFYYFEPADDSIYPLYRHFPNHVHPSGFKPNGFGFRGPDIQLNKPDRVIRVAFIGASTTVNAYGMDYSYPEYIGNWLNLWAIEEFPDIKFEVINAGRAGIASKSISSLFVDEVLPLEPDISVYYEGANQFYPLSYLDFEGKINLNRIVMYIKKRPFERYSAILRRSYAVWDQYNGADGSEPIKLSYAVTWPRHLDENNPDINDPELPLQLNTILSDLDKILLQTELQKSIFVLSSFIWLVEDGMILDPAQDISIWRQLNETFWPIPYSHFRRMANFQNRVFKNYAQARNIPFIDVDSKFPKDPRWFTDAIHMNKSGLRLRAWITFQLLLPTIKSGIDSGRFPKSGQVQLAKHPNIPVASPKLISREEILSKCNE